MPIDAEFHRAVQQAIARTDRSRTVPDVLAETVTAVLALDGASLSVGFDDRRIPLGASSRASAIAEAQQFTVGAGPCLDAIRHGIMIDAAGPVLHERWPALATAWEEHTPFRSVMSAPVPIADGVNGALNMLFEHDAGGQHLEPSDVHIAAGLTGLYLGEWASSGTLDVDTLTATRPAQRRAQVWVAVGMLLDHDVSAPDALAMLRGNAFSRNVSIDDVAEDLVSGRLSIHDVLKL